MNSLQGVMTPDSVGVMTPTKRTIKVSIPITLEIDVDAYCTEYGLETVAEVREDVKSHVTNTIRQHLDSLGVLA